MLIPIQTMNLYCQHDKAKLKQEKTNAGIIYRCQKCHCVYRMMIVTNDKDCWNKRFPAKPFSLKELKKKAKK